MGDHLLPALDGAFGDRADAVVVAGRSSSWSALRARADATAARLVDTGPVVVDATPSLDTVVAVTTGLLAGVPVVPVPPDAGPTERGHIVRDSAATAVLGPAGWHDVDLPRIPLAEAGASGPSRPLPPIDAAALVMYTSGTTGPPKGVQLSHRALAADLDALAAAWRWGPDDVLVHGLPLFHVHGLVLGVLGALRHGCGLVHTGRPTPDAYARAVESGGTLLFGVPTVWSRLVADEAAARSLRGARLLVSGSAPLPVPVFEQLRRLTGHAPVERYGMTRFCRAIRAIDDLTR